MATQKEKRIRVTLVRSKIGQKPSHKKTIQALGLRKIRHTREIPDSPQVRGMINKVRHMVTWEEI